MAGLYNQFKTEVMKKTIDLVNDTIKVALLDNTYTFAASDLGWAAVSAKEISGTGYVAGGATLGTKTVTQDDTGNKGVFDAADVQWTGATFSARFAEIYDYSVASPAKPLIGAIDFSTDKTVTAGTFTITWDSAGIVTIS